MEYVIRAKQALTMTGWDEKPDFASAKESLNALRDRDESLLGLISDAAITVKDGVIIEICPWRERSQPDLERRVDTRLAMPAWVECHTHALFAGRRAAEFAQRNAGVPYVEILESGGGILSTVARTSNADDEDLARRLLLRLEDFARRGIGSVEVKSGYGLSVAEELRHLRIIGQVAEKVPIHVSATFLGAHAVPQGWRDNPSGYVDMVIDDMLPRVAEQGIANVCDVFCDRGAFDLESSERILKAAREHDLEIRIHAEEITHTGGAAMAASMGALSADHCDHIDDAGVNALVENDCVSVLLPGVTVYLDMKERAPARQLIDQGGKVALSTDFNPGSCMTQDLAAITTLGCTLFKLTPGEALWAVTAGAAQAMGTLERAGTLEVGKPADISCFHLPDFADIPYELGRDSLTHLIVNGEVLVENEPYSVA